MNFWRLKTLNIPNKITISRICLIPVFLIIMLVPFKWGQLIVGEYSLPVSHFVGALSLLLLRQRIGLTVIMLVNIIW